MADTPPRKKSFAEMRRELAAARGRTIEEPAKSERKLRSVPKVDEDLIPDVLGDRSEDDIEIDNVIERIDVLDAYRRWIGKEVEEKTTSATEGIKVSCPNPGHRDKNPSAWLNSEKRTWYCGGCQEGGDLYDLAAIKFGYDRPGYKEGKTFHELRKEMAESYGYRVKTVAGKEVVWKEEEAQPVAESKSSKIDHASEESSNEGSRTTDKVAGDLGEEPPKVTFLREEDADDPLVDAVGYPTLNWREIVPEDTFLWKYMEATSNDDSPEEYHFWHGLLALGSVVGRKVYLDDMKLVYGNMLVCLLGGTGYGKTRSRGWLETVIEETAPFRDNGLDTSGCKLVPVPASGENLINQFQHIAYDPSLGKNAPEVRTPVTGIVDYDEFSSLLARCMRQGSTLKPYIQAFADSRNRVTSSSNTGGTFEAYQPFCSITASTQPKAVRALLSKYDAGSGFLNRWVFVGGPRKKIESIGGKRSGIRVDLEPAIEELKAVRGWGAMERSVELTDDGFKEWDSWFHKEIDPARMRDETDLLSRLDLILKRVLLLMAINDRTTEIDQHAVQRIKPLFDYLIHCYGILNAEIGITQMGEITTEIMRHIKNIEEKTGRGASARDLGLRMKRKNYSPDLIKKALETMVALDWIDVDKTKGPGRPSVRYKVVAS